MGWLPVIAAAVAAWRLHRSSHATLFWLAVAAAIVDFWSWGIMHNFAIGAAARRREFLLRMMREEGRPEGEVGAIEMLPVEISSFDAQRAPNWATLVNIGSTLLGIFLLGVSFFV